MVNPDWLQTPDSDAMAKAFPEVAGLLGVDGYALIRCQITVLGRADACTVVGESPSGWGFGNAALIMSQSFRFRPKTVDGRAVPGGEIRVPLRLVTPIPGTCKFGRLPAARSLCHAAETGQGPGRACGCPRHHLGGR
uniref:TonB family protein n=1 Tax=Phenylobacterium glaciei TaxID=2803784 RepID=A0A974P4D4_9CAUL|nr:TonB family protein [Phenylobacterium glaciei]